MTTPNPTVSATDRYARLVFLSPLRGRLLLALQRRAWTNRRTWHRRAWSDRSSLMDLGCRMPTGSNRRDRQGSRRGQVGGIARAGTSELAKDLNDGNDGGSRRVRTSKNLKMWVMNQEKGAHGIVRGARCSKSIRKGLFRKSTRLNRLQRLFPPWEAMLLFEYYFLCTYTNSPTLVCRVMTAWDILVPQVRGFSHCFSRLLVDWHYVADEIYTWTSRLGQCVLGNRSRFDFTVGDLVKGGRDFNKDKCYRIRKHSFSKTKCAFRIFSKTKLDVWLIVGI